jgi:hypothetical protein
VRDGEGGAIDASADQAAGSPRGEQRARPAPDVEERTSAAGSLKDRREA